MDKSMVQICIAAIFGCTIYFLYSYMGIFPAVGFIIIYMVLLKKDFKKPLAFIVIGFSMLFFVNCIIYFYGVHLGENVKCRIVDEGKDYYIGSLQNRRIKIFPKNKSIQLGRKYILKGEFNRKADYSKGIIGDYNIIDSKPLKEDLIYKGYMIKNQLYQKILTFTDEEGAAIILAVSGGDDSYIDYDKREEFSVLGISHIISVSGLHVSLIYQVLQGIIGYKLALIVLFFYVIFTGGKSSTFRAFIMILLLVLGPKVKKTYEGVSALAFAAFLLLLIKPYYILDIGYVLSFLAVLGIFTLNNKIKRKFYKLPDFIASSLSLTLSSMIFTTPYIIMRFNTVSLGGFISNLLLIPFYTFLLVLGNLLFLFIKIPTVFNLLSLITNSVLLIINTMEEFLVNILPAPLEFTYFEGIMILILYLSYILIRRGVKSLRYLPILLFLFTIKEQYIIYPEINLIAGKKSDIVEINYGMKKVMVSSKKVKLKYVYENYKGLDRIYDEFEEDMTLKLSKSCSIDIKDKDGNLALSINHRGEISNITIDKEYEKEALQCCYKSNSSSTSPNCDIIRINRKREEINLGHYYENYKLIGGKVYHNYVH
ncbi:ComEC/Rec2 family competence protein [Clostridium sp.]|uniref:ComEC/Rec2 family competence protein n=1 Tax=Clostridium sp. TaxID=1506 RepID=UPI003216394C